MRVMSPKETARLVWMEQSEEGPNRWNSDGAFAEPALERLHAGQEPQQIP